MRFKTTRKALQHCVIEGREMRSYGPLCPMQSVLFNEYKPSGYMK